MWAEESECLDLMSCYIFLFFKPAGDLGFAFPGGGTLVRIYLPVQEMQETWVPSLNQEDPLE